MASAAVAKTSASGRHSEDAGVSPVVPDAAAIAGSVGELGERIADVAEPLPPVLLETAGDEMAHACRGRARQRVPVGLLLEHRSDGIGHRRRVEWRPS